MVKELAGEEIVEPKRACKAMRVTRRAPLAAREALNQSDNTTTRKRSRTYSHIHPSITLSRSRPISSRGPSRGGSAVWSGRFRLRTFMGNLNAAVPWPSHSCHAHTRLVNDRLEARSIAKSRTKIKMLGGPVRSGPN